MPSAEPRPKQERRTRCGRHRRRWTVLVVAVLPVGVPMASVVARADPVRSGQEAVEEATIATVGGYVSPARFLA
ncbi:MAG: hypothetical protein ACLQCU_04065 [Acidimicrobiales bacterium]